MGGDFSYGLRGVVFVDAISGELRLDCDSEPGAVLYCFRVALIFDVDCCSSSLELSEDDEELEEELWNFVWVPPEADLVETVRRGPRDNHQSRLKWEKQKKI